MKNLTNNNVSDELAQVFQVEELEERLENKWKAETPEDLEAAHDGRSF